MITLGETDYHQASLERFQEATLLLKKEYYAGSAYLAGRAVESMFRCLIWKKDNEIKLGKKALETGHDLREAFDHISDLGLLRQGGRDDEFLAHVQKVNRLWLNNMRFFSNKRIDRYWWGLGEVCKKRTIKRVAHDFYEACMAILKRCERLYNENNKSYA